MRARLLKLTATLAGLALLGTLAVRAGGDLVKFPEGYDKGVLYTTVDRADNKQYRELYINKEASEAAKAGKPLPSGTVITLVAYKAKLDEKGEPVKDGNGRFVNSGELVAVNVMEKRDGWGTEYPPELRNGEWEYQSFTPAKAVNTKANLKGCFECHKPKDREDYLFTLQQIKAGK